MRKYLLGITAVILAAGFSAFTKPAEKKRKTTDYYFSVSSNSTICSTITVAFPTNVPPTSVSSCTGSSKFCWIAFPNYVQILGTYRPSQNGTTEETNYCSFSQSELKN